MKVYENKNNFKLRSKAATGGVLLRKLFLKVSQYSQEYCEIFENTYFEEHLRTTVFVRSFGCFLLNSHDMVLVNIKNLSS